MQEKYTYLLVDFFCIIFPFLFSFHPKFKFYPQWKYFAMPAILTASFFIIWDIFFTSKGVWSFNPEFVVGIYFLGLPLEEYLFFLFIPYACVFTYFCITTYLDFSKYNKPVRLFTLVLALLIMLFGEFHLSQWYTSSTFILLAIALFLIWLLKVDYLPSFFITFLLILIPFFISNGILTGSFIRQPVVLYNNNYNLGIRMSTIPVEDTFYGMLLMLMNVAGYEYLRKK